ncbi:MAG TPA: hypothetical protein VFD17_01950 [Clostridia bacterium]|nr:hypothetical protein [Clostridia bacterium]
MVVVIWDETREDGTTTLKTKEIGGLPEALEFINSLKGESWATNIDIIEDEE